MRADAGRSGELREEIGAVYLHIPFCRSKCAYCDFLSFAAPESMQAYVEALIEELRLAVARYPVRARTIYIGGGTPSVLPAPLFARLLDAVRRELVTPQLAEYTVEANPGTLAADKLAVLRDGGVNRLSLGVQSIDAAQLARLGRIHTFAEAREAVALAREAGFGNLNLDFMYGLPGQSLEDWARALDAAVALAPEHLSVYQLNIEPGTAMAERLARGEIEPFDDETALEMYRMGQRRLREAGYRQYEISNYAKPGYESRHNRTYWRTEPYLGLGLGASSWLRPLRWKNVDNLQRYLSEIAAGRLPQSEPERLSEAEQMEETVFMALRMNEGLDSRLFRRRFGRPVEEVFKAPIERSVERGLLRATEHGYCLTEEGRVLGNLVFAEFIL